ncbi:hypothetical protein N0V90_003396 [Kalmusia sp. IMI 367209]|nr:hypothetical protein N0V90_003396 [Kalmusia sp. IMI 367209]
MAAEIQASPMLDPQLYEDWDDEDDIRWKSPLEALINGTQTPLQAAQSVDNMTRIETNERLQKLVNYAKLHKLTAEEQESSDWGGLCPPNAGSIAHEVLRAFCRVSTAFSPYSEGQNRLIEFLEELRNLPRWMEPETRPDENGKVHRTEFWAFGYSWIGLEDEFRRQHDAAAQWIIWPIECRYVYQECLKRETMDHFWEPWSRNRWSQWKKEFGSVLENDKYDDKTKSVVRKALREIKDIEKEIIEEDSGESDQD